MYAIVDIETTGGRKDIDRITEIAIVIHDGHKIVEQFSTLLNPERNIPYNITQLTGITNEMVTDAPYFYEVAKQIVQLTEKKIFVAHNVNFDYRFLQAEFQRLGFVFKRKKLCTVRLSKRMYPKLRSHSLAAMIRFLNIKVQNRHRALDDTLAATVILEKALAEENKEKLNQLLNFGVQESKLPPNITLEILHEIPEACGVYYFHNKKGEVIYVGKSINIKKRIMEHFASKTQKAERMQQEVHEFSFEITGSDLVAMLYESDQIKAILPKHNRAQRSRRYPFCIHTYKTIEGYQCFGVARTKNGLDIVAEYSKQLVAKSALRKMVVQYNLCERYTELDFGNSACFRRHLNECKGACLKEETPEEYNKRAKIAQEKTGIGIEGNIIVVEKGKTPTEQAVVMIEDGHYQGFGFVDMEEVQSIEDYKNAIKFYQHNPEVIQIIQNYLKKAKGVKVIKW